MATANERERALAFLFYRRRKQYHQSPDRRGGSHCFVVVLASCGNLRDPLKLIRLIGKYELNINIWKRMKNLTFLDYYLSHNN